MSEGEARLKEVLEMRKRVLRVSLEWRGDRELGSRNMLSVKVWMAGFGAETWFLIRTKSKMPRTGSL